MSGNRNIVQVKPALDYISTSYSEQMKIEDLARACINFCEAERLQLNIIKEGVYVFEEKDADFGCSRDGCPDCRMWQ